MTSSSSTSSFSLEDVSDRADETCGCEVGCGNKRKRFQISICQCFASPKFALLFLCLASIGQGFLTSGLLSVVITTLEKRFHLRSTESGFIASSYDISSCLVVLIITYVGGRGHKPLWIGWGTFIMGIGSLVFTLPHFIAPTYTFGIEEHNICNSTIISHGCIASNLQSYMFFFVLGQLLHGAGGTTLFTLGVTYLDENVEQLYSSLYHGVYYSSSVIGPAFGFLLGARFLTIYTNTGTSVSITEESPLWVGAWWLGFLVGGIVVTAFAIPILLFPKQLPNTSHARVNRETEMHQDTMAVKATQDKALGRRLSDIWSCILVLLRNPTFILVTLGGALDSGLVIGLTTFGPKYLESMFNITPTQAATYFGILAIVAGATGQFVGGVIVTKAKLTVSGILKLCAVCGSVTACTAFIFLLTCPDILFAGSNFPYMNATDTLSAYSHEVPCNMHCHCNPDSYDPVCGSDGITYYSPCYAGCINLTLNKLQTYSECSCILGNETSAVVGKCAGKVCNKLSMFLGLFFIAILATFLSATPAIQAILRVVPFTQRSFAIGVKFVILRLLGSIPLPIIFGKVLDLACAVWSTECGKQGSCELYKNEDLASHMTALIAVLKVIVVILYILAWLVYKPPPKSPLDALDQVTLTTTIANNSVGLPTAHGASGGLGEFMRQRVNNLKFDNISYKTLAEETELEF